MLSGKCTIYFAVSICPTLKSLFRPYFTQGRQSNAQIGGNITQIDPAADIGKPFFKFCIPLSGRQCQPFFMFAMEFPVSILMNDSSPISQFYICFVQFGQCLDGDGIEQYIFPNRKTTL